MATQEDTFNKLRRPPIEEVVAKVKTIKRETKAEVAKVVKVIEATGWTLEEYRKKVKELK